MWCEFLSLQCKKVTLIPSPSSEDKQSIMWFPSPHTALHTLKHTLPNTVSEQRNQNYSDKIPHQTHDGNDHDLNDGNHSHDACCQ